MVVRSLKLILEFLIGASVGATILVSLAIWRLSGEPVSLAFLTPYFEEALSAEDGTFRVELNDTVLTWAGWERTLDIRLRDVRAIGNAGQILAMVPEISVSISGRGLLHGIVAPTSLEIMGANVRVVRSPSGEFELGLEKGGAAAGDIVERLITDLLAPPHPDRSMGYLSRVSILDADLTIVDDKLGTTWYAPWANISLLRDDVGITGELSFDLDLEGKLAHFDAEVGYSTEAQKIELGASFSDLDLGRLSAKSPLFAAVKDVETTLSGTLAATVNLDGRVEVLGFDLSAGPGRLALPDLYEDELPIVSVHARGRFEEDLSRMVLDEFFVDVGGPTVTLAALVFRVGGDFAVQGEAVVRDLPVDSFDRYWPPAVAADQREWIVGHLSRGSVGAARAVFAARVPEGGLNALEIASIAGTIEFSGVSVDYLPPMPMVEEVSGQAYYTSERFDIDITGGVLRGLTVEEGTINVTGLDVADQDAAIEVVIRGPFQDAMIVLDHEPLGAAEYLGIAPESVGGEIAIRATFRLPLEKDLALEQVEISAAANLSGVRIPGAVFGRDLTDGVLTLKADRVGMQYQGNGKVDGIPAALSGTESFLDTAGVRSQYTLKARVDHNDLAALGFTTAPYLQGPITVDLIHTVMDGGKSDLSVAADLEDSVLNFEGIDWAKPAGVAGTARFSMSMVGERPTVLRGFQLVAGDLAAAGSAVFAPARPGAPQEGAALDRLEFTRLAFGRTDVRGTVAFRKDGGYDVELSGPVIDAAKFFSFKDEGEAKADESEPESRPIRLSAKVQRLWVTPESYVSDVDCQVFYDGESWRSLALKGRIDGATDDGGVFLMRLVPEGAVRKLSVTSNDAGSFLRSFGYLDNVAGGTFELTGTIDDSLPDQPVEGKVVVKNYRLIGAPVLAKLLTAASLTGVLNLLSGEGIGFTGFDGPFRMADGVLEIKDARAYGADLGITVKGKINVASDTVDLEGTLVPAYLINSILGHIPVVGDLLTGDPGSGVFAVAYKVQGPRDEPKVTANPLTALAPGFLRKLFNIFDRPEADDSEDESEAEPPQEPQQWPNSLAPSN
ncbi:MAG: AsmA-like C-terminal domain-containing protein [Alphaproteobacteria bacterium]